VGTTIFTVMSQLAAEHKAINLGQGFPDFDCDPALKTLLAQACDAGHNQYAPMTGIAALRQAVAAKNAHLYGHAYDADREVTVTAGATQALMAAIVALVHPGDEVVVLEPAYDSYLPCISLAGGHAVCVPLDAQRGYAPDWERIGAAIGPRTRALILNFPHNPSGRVLHPEDLQALEALVARHPLLLISDEVYEHIVFDGQPHRSLAGRPALAERSVVISSFGKTFHTTGWKVGTVCASARLTAEIRKVHQFMVFAVNTPAQHALAGYLSDSGPYLRLPAFYQAKRDRFLAGMRGLPFRLLPCEGTYFVLADYRAVSDLPDEAFSRWLLTEIGVATIPTSVFYRQPVDHGIVRFCFAKKDETLDAAIARLQRLMR
jgi:methionine aminotransferase